MTIYFLPTSKDALQDRIFEINKNIPKYEGGLLDFDFWGRFSEAAQSLGIEAHTFDMWDKRRSGPDDILLVQNHPGETFPWRVYYFLKYFKHRGGFMLERRRFFNRNYKFFSKRILIQAESPAIIPYAYRSGRINALQEKRIYNKIFLLSQGNGNDRFHYYFYRDRNIISPYFDGPKDGFLTMVNANMLIHSFKNELYGERLKAIKYFSVMPSFDLYGYGWDKRPRHPFYFHYKEYVARVWRGSVVNKVKTMSRYKFSLCFENCVYPGYISEKIFDCLAAGSIPIYLGAPDINSLVPKTCFIDFREFRNYDELNKFLSSVSPERVDEYRQTIKSFLADRSNLKDIKSFVNDLTE